MVQQELSPEKEVAVKKIMTDFVITLEQKDQAELSKIYPGKTKDLFDTVTESEDEGDQETEGSSKKKGPSRDEKGRFSKKEDKDEVKII